MAEYFSFRHVPAPNTAIDPIKKLEPGQSLIVKKSGEMYKNRYFEATKDGTICTNDQRAENKGRALDNRETYRKLTQRKCKLHRAG